jgi:branched-chain amino acid transport system substrate-binding protein
MKKYWLTGLVLAAGLGLASTADAQIKFAVAGPITGPNASFGAQLTNGVGQAVEDFNKAGGILGQKLELEQGDDVSDPKQGVSVANKFVGDGVHFVVGHFNSGVTIPASEVYADNDILFVTPSATNPKVTDRKLWDAFRTCGRDDQQGKLWADLALGDLKDKKIAIVHDKTPYGQGLADAARGFMNAGGKKEVLYEGVNVGEKDYSAIVSKIKAAGADYVMWGGLHTEGGLIVRQMRDQGMKTIMISGDGITDNEFASIGGPGVEGTLMSFGPEPRNNPIRKATRSTRTPGCRSSSRRWKRPTRPTRTRSPTSCIRAWRSRPCWATSLTTPRATALRWTTSGTSGRRTQTARSISTRCDRRQPALG